jgi:hypothetical protein
MRKRGIMSGVEKREEKEGKIKKKSEQSGELNFE